jgi:hypothetical protein
MKHRILLQHFGENSTTSKTPAAEVLSQDGDVATVRRNGEVETVNLKETKTCCLSFDNDMLVQESKYAVCEVDLPDWMSPAEYIRHQVAWKWFLGFGGKPTWPRQWFYRLDKLGEYNRFAAIKLLNVKNFRSPFRMSLRSQLEAWLKDPNPKYESPFSRKQWDAVLDGHTCLAAKRTSQSLYWQR